MEHEYAEAMKALARRYYDHEISKTDYRAQRKALIDHMDNEFNGEPALTSSNSNSITAAARE